MPHTPHSTPAAPDADDSPVDIVLRWRRGQVAFVSTLFPGGMLAADATHDLSTAHAAACTTDPALSARSRVTPTDSMDSMTPSSSSSWPAPSPVEI